MEQAAEEEAQNTGQKVCAQEAGADGAEIKGTGSRKNREAEQAPPEVVLLAFAGGCFSQDAQERMEWFLPKIPRCCLPMGTRT